MITFPFKKRRSKRLGEVLKPLIPVRIGIGEAEVPVRIGWTLIELDAD